jgi:hypothetical protein
MLPNKAAMAIAPPHSLPKDAICIIKGARMPYVYGRGVKDRGNFIILSVAAIFIELWMARFAFKKRIRLLLHK